MTIHSLFSLLSLKSSILRLRMEKGLDIRNIPPMSKVEMTKFQMKYWK